MAQWVPIPINQTILTNVDETSLGRQSAALENGYVNDVGGHTRFPGLIPFATVSPGRVYTFEYRGDMIAVTSLGRVWRVSRNGTTEDITEVAVTGGRRPIFSATEDELLVAAGGPIVAFSGNKTEILSADAPETTHVAYSRGYALAIEKDSQRANYSDPGTYTIWPALNVFSAEGKPDSVTALIITPYEEILLAGPKSIEQFETSPSGSNPFYRRWMAGQGLLAPYTLVATKFGTYGVSQDAEFVRFVNQTTDPESDAIQSTLDKIDSWTDAWAKEMIMFGQRFIILQMPEATNIYGTKGVTLIYDEKRRYWYSLYGWDSELNRPARWPGWSHEFIWSRHFVGGDGVIYEMREDAYANAGLPQRYLARTGHYQQEGEDLRLDDLRLRFKRGAIDPNTGRNPILALRVNKDNQGFGSWIRKPLGQHGQRNMVLNYGSLGTAATWQFEWFVVDEAPIELVSIEARVERI